MVPAITNRLSEYSARAAGDSLTACDRGSSPLVRPACAPPAPGRESAVPQGKEQSGRNRAREVAGLGARGRLPRRFAPAPPADSSNRAKDSERCADRGLAGGGGGRRGMGQPAAALQLRAVAGPRRRAASCAPRCRSDPCRAFGHACVLFQQTGFPSMTRSLDSDLTRTRRRLGPDLARFRLRAGAPAPQSTRSAAATVAKSIQAMDRGRRPRRLRSGGTGRPGGGAVASRATGRGMLLAAVASLRRRRRASIAAGIVSGSGKPPAARRGKQTIG